MNAYSEKYNYLIRWNGKSGCSYFRQLFLYLHESELKKKPKNKWHDLNIDFPLPKEIALKKVTKLVLVRNPYERVVSMFCNKYCGGEGHNLLSKKMKLEKCTFRHFVYKLRDLKNNNKLNNYDIHIREQAYNCKIDDKTTIIKLESFNKSIKNIYRKNKNLRELLPKVLIFLSNDDKIVTNKTTRTQNICKAFDIEYSVDHKVFPTWKAFYNKDIKLIVDKIYKSDFLLFNYPTKI